MAYTVYDPETPKATTQNGTQFSQSTRDNLKAIRDAAIMGGGFFGWAMAATGGTPDQPTLLTYSKGTERVKAEITWGTTGGANGNVQSVVYSYSSTSGSSYDAIGTKTITYDANANVTATSWS